MNQFIRLIDRLFRPVQRHVGTRFILVSSLLLLGALSVGVTTYQSLIKMQNKIDKEMTEQVATLTNNAEISREALELFIHINVFENTIGFDSTQLTKEGLSIGERLQKIKSFSNNQAMLGVLDNFIDDIHRLIGNALAMNNIQVEELQEIMKLKELVNSAYQPLYQSKILKILNDIVLQSSELIAQLRSQIPPKDAMILLAEINLSFEHFSEKLNKENILIDYAELSSQLKVRIEKSKEVTKKLKVNLLQRQKIKDDLARSRQALLFLIKKQERTAGDNVSNLKNDFNSAVLKVNTSTSIITLIVILLGGLLILYMVRQHINKPMEDLIKGINKVESKNFNGPAICLNRKDEWDSLERAFNNMAMGLSESYEQLNNERQRFDFLAHHDPLTGLVNRLFINKELESIAEKAKQSHQSFAVIYMDLDQFKRINDSLGHIIGDGLLKQVAKRILKTLNGEGHAARLGGDEFLLVLPHMPNKQKAKEFASQLNKVIAEPYSLDSQNIFITNSIGICFYPNDAEDVTKLVRNADTALYQAKRAGRDCYKFYNKEMTSHAYQLLDQNSGIRRALENDEFRLLFQPKVNLLSGEMVGAEVLIRWQHPDIGLLTPNKFLPAAEEIGLITEIDDWVFEKLCLQLVDFEAKKMDIHNLSFSCNFSGRQFLRNDLVEKIQLTLDKTGCNPNLLEVEITEQDIMTNLSKCASAIKKLQNLGICLSIDDFGTGYSSLSYIKHLPASILKIDRSFIKDICENKADLAIVKSILSLANSMDMKVVAEGIETKAQANQLTMQGCQFGQGYYYSHPLTLDDFENYLIQRNRKYS